MRALVRLIWFAVVFQVLVAILIVIVALLVVMAGATLVSVVGTELRLRRMR